MESSFDAVHPTSEIAVSLSQVFDDAECRNRNTEDAGTHAVNEEAPLSTACDALHSVPVSADSDLGRRPIGCASRQAQHSDWLQLEDKIRALLKEEFLQSTRPLVSCKAEILQTSRSMESTLERAVARIEARLDQSFTQSRTEVCGNAKEFVPTFHIPPGNSCAVSATCSETPQKGMVLQSRGSAVKTSMGRDSSVKVRGSTAVGRSSEQSMAKGVSMTDTKSMRSATTLEPLPIKKEHRLSKIWGMVTKSPEERRLELLGCVDSDNAEGAADDPESEVAVSKPRRTAMRAVRCNYECRQRLKDLMSSSIVEMFFGFAIVTNSIFVGLEVDWISAHPTEQIPVTYQAVGYLYTTLFTLELAARLVADWRGFLWTTGNQMCWNYLDVLIVVSSLLEVLLDIIKNVAVSSDGSGGVNLSNFRIIRIIRITKLMRLFRIGRIVKFVRALRMLIMSIVSTLKQVYWSLMLLTIIIYVFAIMFTQAATDYSVEVSLDSAAARLTVKEERDLDYYWGSLAESMLALFMSISGGVSWVEVCQPLRKVKSYWLYIFLAYISFVYFAVLNVVTGVFCQSAIESQQNDQEGMVQAFLQNKELYTDRFRKLFRSIDVDDSGLITKEEFEKKIEESGVQAYFATLGIDPGDARTLFRLLDETPKDGAEPDGIDIEDFVHGCLRLKGQARSADLARLLHENRALSREVCAVHALLKHNFPAKEVHKHGADDQ